MAEVKWQMFVILEMANCKPFQFCQLPFAI
jgi:hypothetical protein